MLPRSHTLPPGQPDSMLLRRLFFVQRGLLALVMLIALSTLAAWVFPDVEAAPIMAFVRLSTPTALTVALCVLSLLMSEPNRSALQVRLSRLLAGIAALLSVALLFERFAQLSILPDSLLNEAHTSAIPSALSPQSAAAFFSIAIVVASVGSKKVIMQYVADLLILFQCLLALVLLTQNMFGALDLFGVTTANRMSPQALCCILLLTAVLVLRQAQWGILSIFLGSGIGSRIARAFAPILLVLPFFREIVESQPELRALVPAHSAASTLTSFEAAFLFALLLVVVWRINDMEKEIHDLTLRDELTGLYNMRGFYLLAEQTFRLAKRARQPFSVLFLDLDGLKQINDMLGHNVGSAYLAETGEIVFAHFRDGDVKGRFGGDEFVIAGQFSVVGIELAAARLRAAAAERNAQGKRQFPLSFSIGYVTVDYYSTETLQELVVRADHAMYKDKQGRKVARQ